MKKMEACTNFDYRQGWIKLFDLSNFAYAEF